MTDSRQSIINRRAYGRSGIVREYDAMSGGLFDGERVVLQRIAGEISGQPALDIGVGAGRTTPAMLQITTDYLGIDFSDAMITRCKAKYPGVRFAVCDARHMEGLGRECFAFVWFSFNGLDCVNGEERQKVLLNIFDLLRPGGILFFSSHNLWTSPQRPWQFKRYKTKLTPKNLIRNALLMARCFSNYLQFRTLQVEGERYAFRLASGHAFSCVHFYVDPAEQAYCLEKIGFVNIETMGWSGMPRPSDHHDVKTAAHVYYLGRKPGPAKKTL